jgi:glycosyltransferase involved in cell wall biosynthesis
VVISGKMSYHANVAMVLHFVRDILPLIRAQRPDVRLCLVGKEPPREIRTLARDPAITVTGTVSDVRPYLRQATVAVAPLLYGVGIQNKVLEAMACATPTVATPQAVSALPAPVEGAVAVAASDRAFAEEVLALLAEPRRRREIGAAGRRYVETHHSWKGIVAQLEGAYHEIMAASSEHLF